LFSHLGVLDESDLGMPLSSLGVELIVEAEPPVFALPCPAVERGICTIYHLQRPRACGWFECDLSTAVAEGQVPADEARTIIIETLALRDRVRSGAAEQAELRARVQQHFRRADD